MRFFCCCGAGCDVGRDEFDAGVITASWVTESGTWSVAAEQLVASVDGRLIFQPHVAPTDALKLTVRMQATAGSTAAARLLLAYRDEDNYLFVEVRTDATDCPAIQLGQRSVGVEAWLADAVPLMAGAAWDDLLLVEVCLIPDDADSGTLEASVAIAGDGQTGNAQAVATYSLIVPIEDEDGEELLDEAGAPLEDEASDTSGDLLTGLEVTNGSWVFDDWLLKHHRGVGHTTCPDCDPGCLIHGDTFNRSDLGCLWEQVAGTWSIASGEATTAGASALLVTELRHPDRLPSSYAKLTIANCASGSTVRLISNYKDANNYHFVQATLTTTGATLSLFRRSGGANTPISSVSTPPLPVVDCTVAVTLELCVHSGSASAALSPAALVAAGATTPITGGDRAGFGTGSVAGIGIDTFTFERHVDADHECSECPVACGNCNTPPARRYRIDLGAGGWAAGFSAYCADVLGEYLLDFVTNCGWLYVEEDVHDASADCTGASNGNGQVKMYFAISATLGPVSGDIRWTVTVQLNFRVRDPTANCPGPDHSYFATYLSPIVDPDECLDPQTLTKDSDNEDLGYPCVGELPNTIELEAVS